MKAMLLPTVLLAAMSGAPVDAVVITEDLSGVEVSDGTVVFGQAFTTPSGGPWKNITFNFYDPSGAPTASGKLYMLSAPYFGAPSQLSAASTVLAGSITASGGRFIYAAAFVMMPDTPYFAYAYYDPTPVRYNGTSYSGGSYAFSTGSNQPYQHPNSNDVNFTVSGTVVPEPASWALLITGFTVTGVAMRRRKVAVTA